MFIDLLLDPTYFALAFRLSYPSEKRAIFRT